MPPNTRSRAQLAEADPTPAATARTQSHSTQVEQSRAVAQVEAAMVAAKRFPRDEDTAREKIVKACRRTEVYSKAFYRFPRGKDDEGKTNMVTGPSIHLLREVARLWQNIDYGVAEIERHDMGGGQGESEMLSFAWDMEGNVRASTVYRVPWIRVSRVGGITYLGDDPRDVYENNANQGSRRTRAMLEAVIPREIVALAEATCREAIKAEGRGQPIEARRRDALAAFEQFGVSQRQMEDKLGRPVDVWGPEDMIVLRVIHDSLVSGESTIGEEFPTPARRKRAALDEQPDREAEDAGDADSAEAAGPAAPPVATPQTPEAGTESGDAVRSPEPTPTDTVATPTGGPMSAEISDAVSAWFTRYGMAGVARRKRRDWIVREVLGVAGDEYGLADLTEESGRDLLTGLAALTKEDRQRFGLTPPDTTGDPQS